MARIMKKLCTHDCWILRNTKPTHKDKNRFWKFSTIQQIVWLNQEMKDDTDKKETVLALFVHFKGAYASVWRLKLLSKMQNI